MRIGIETMIQTFFLCAACLLFTGMIGSNLYILQARNCFYLLADQIEYSGLDDEVIQQCQEEAQERGYRLECQRIEGDRMLLSLYYDVTVSVFGGEEEIQEGVIQGYAR